MKKKNIFNVSLRKKNNPQLLLLLRWVVSSIDAYNLGTNLHSSHIDDMVHVCNCVLVIWAWLVMNFGFASTSPLRGGNPVCQVLKIQLYFIEFSICGSIHGWGTPFGCLTV